MNISQNLLNLNPNKNLNLNPKPNPYQNPNPNPIQIRIHPKPISNLWFHCWVWENYQLNSGTEPYMVCSVRLAQQIRFELNH